MWQLFYYGNYRSRGVGSKTAEFPDITLISVATVNVMFK